MAMLRSVHDSHCPDWVAKLPNHDSKHETSEYHARVYQKEIRKLWLPIRVRALKPMDLMVAAYLASYMNIGTGQIRVSVKEIAADLNLDVRYLHGSIKRLRKQMCLAKGIESTGYFWMLNPHIWSSGPLRSQGKRVAAFRSLLNKESYDKNEALETGEETWSADFRFQLTPAVEWPPGGSNPSGLENNQRCVGGDPR